jgi:hypothetical protein
MARSDSWHQPANRGKPAGVHSLCARRPRSRPSPPHPPPTASPRSRHRPATPPPAAASALPPNSPPRSRAGRAGGSGRGRSAAAGIRMLDRLYMRMPNYRVPCTTHAAIRAQQPTEPQPPHPYPGPIPEPGQPPLPEPPSPHPGPPEPPPRYARISPLVRRAAIASATAAALALATAHRAPAAGPSHGSPCGPSAD